MTDLATAGMVSKPVQKLVGRLTLFQGISQVLSHRKQHDNKRLACGWHRAGCAKCKLQLGSLRAIPDWRRYQRKSGLSCPQHMRTTVHH